MKVKVSIPKELVSLLNILKKSDKDVVTDIKEIVLTKKD